ncbi:hypothetical protein, partial [Burkholderia ubonensis]|uniref:hypothetical protein n=1 Tax=Burkholderia ubonensis TaxID=101571 RepID=UPI001E607765
CGNRADDHAPGFGVLLEGLGNRALRGAKGFGAGHGLSCSLSIRFFAEAEGITDGRTHVQQTATVRNNVRERTCVTHRKPAVFISYKRFFFLV